MRTPPRPLIALGLIAAMPSAAIAQTDYSWAAPVSGNWSAPANWNPTGSPGANPFDTATLGLIGSYTVAADTSRTLSSVFIDNPLAALSIRPGTNLTIRDAILGTGGITLHDRLGSDVATLTLSNGAALGGVITLNAPTAIPARAAITGPIAPDEFASFLPDVIIRGNGLISGNFEPGFNGTISADMLGAVLRIHTATPFHSSGTLRAINGGRLSVGSDLIGGTLHGDANSRIYSESASVSDATLSGTVVVASPGSSLTLGTGNTFTGEIVLNNGSTTTTNFTLALLDGAAVGGTITLNAPAQYTNYATIAGPTNADQLAFFLPDTIIRGCGRITGRFASGFDGTIRADVPGGTLWINTATPFHSAGTLEAVGGGVLHINPALSGGTLYADEHSRIASSSAGISGTDFSGTIKVARPGGTSFTIGQENIYNGTIIVHDGVTTGDNYTLFLLNKSTLGGTVVLNSNLYNQHTARIAGPTSPGESAVIIPTARIRGSGNITGHVVNQGTISADKPGPGHHIGIATTGPLYSTGTLEAINGGTLSISSGLVGGSLYADINSRVLSGQISDTTLSGQIAVVGGNASITLGHDNTYTGEILINNSFTDSINSLRLLDGVSLGGVVRLRGSYFNYAVLEGPTTAGMHASIAPDAVVRGVGRITGHLSNAGTISADTPIPDALQGTLWLSTTGPLLSTGTIESVNGGRLWIQSDLTGGTLHADADSRVSSLLNTNISGVTFSGTVVLDQHHPSLTLGPGNTYNGEIVANDGSDAAYTISVLNGADFGGVITLKGFDHSSAVIAGPAHTPQVAAILPGTTVRGTGQISGRFSPVFSGTLAPSHPTNPAQGGNLHIITFSGLTMTPEAITEFGLFGTSTPLYDRITGSATAPFQAAGLCRITLGDGYIPSSGDSWHIIDDLSITGAFDTLDLPTAPPGLAYRMDYQPNRVTLRLTCAADFAAPWGDLNFFDLSAYMAAFNAQNPSADLAPPFGVFNFFDVAAYLNLYNAGCP